MGRLLTGLALLIVAATSALGVEDEPVSPPPAGVLLPPDQPSAEARFNAGLALARQSEWRHAAEAYRDAVRLRPEFPEAWNGLGYTLRKLGRYEESLGAYYEALRLRPDYPQALEYLGEAYVDLGRLAEARVILARLRRLDPKTAEELEETIQKASTRLSSPPR